HPLLLPLLSPPPPPPPLFPYTTLFRSVCHSRSRVVAIGTWPATRQPVIDRVPQGKNGPGQAVRASFDPGPGPRRTVSHVRRLPRPHSGRSAQSVGRLQCR